MHNTCAQYVNNLFMRSNTICVQQSTDTEYGSEKGNSAWVKEVSNTKVIQLFNDYIPPGILSISCLLNSIFSPVSTAPINNNQKENLRKGNKQWN